jgi:glycosyltransferase involved in cell wall biosynthesis
MGCVTFRHERSLSKLERLVSFIQSERFEFALMPNPYGNEHRRAIYDHLRFTGVPVVAFDRGGLPESWFFDTAFNADSDSYHASRWNRALTERQRADVRAYIQRVRDELPALEAQSERIGADRLRNSLGIEGRKILFVPLQRPSDTSTRFFCAPMANLEAFHDLVGQVVDRIRAELDDWVVVAKKHPLEVVRPDIPVMFADTAHINDLIEMSNAVLLLNSGTGLLSLCWDKPVLIAGTAYYSHPLLNRTVQSVGDVLDALKCLPVVDQDIRDRFFHHLISKVYSFGKFRTELVRQADGSLRNITRHIEFDKVRLPDITRKKALLYVTPVIPWPINRGAAHRTDQVLRALLEQDCAIDLICLNEREAESDNADIEARLRQRYPRLRHVTVCRHPMLPSLGRWSDVVAQLQYQVARLCDTLVGRTGTINAARHCPPLLGHAIKAQMRCGIYDAIWFNYLRVMPRWPITECKIICDLHDYQTERIRADVLPTLPARRRVRHLSRVSRSEAVALARCDVAIAISPIEKEHIVKELRPHGELVVIPATDDSHARREGPIAFDLLYVGSRSEANIVGLRWFIEQCVPRIVAQLPSVRILIQGAIVDMPVLHEVLDRSQSRKNITLSGPADSLEDVYASAKLVVCPVLHGTGMKIKMVEAMSYGHAVVATSKAAEGIATDLGLQTYDTSEDFSDACIRHLSDPDMLARSRIVSRATFSRDHDHKQLIEQIAAVVAGI